MGRGVIPNTITLGRIVLSPVFVFFFWLGGDYYMAALVVGLLFELSDLLDGALARWNNQVTGFGKIFDPLADSISRFTVFLCLLSKGYADVMAVAIIFYRDAIVATVRTFAAYENVIVAARWSGKLKAVVQSIGITAILLMIVWFRDEARPADPAAVHVAVSRYAVWGVAVITSLSGVDYIRANWPLIRSFASK